MNLIQSRVDRLAGFFILIEPENQYALTEAIKKSLVYTYDTIKHNARVFAENYLGIDKVIARYFGEIMKKGNFSGTPAFIKIRDNQLQTDRVV